MSIQKETFEKALALYQKHEPQRDDILVLGFRL
jgi:hypothetical protein